MNTREFSNIAGGKLINLTGDEEIKGYSTDSRKIEDNSLFIPIIGERVNGHDYFTKDLKDRGIMSLWNKDYPLKDGLPVILVEDTKKALYTVANYILKKSQAKVMGISGSNGKTSVKDYLSTILSTKYKVHANKGNLNTDIGLSLTLLDMPEDAEYAVLEMGIERFGEMTLLTQIAPPTHFILTNIGEAHLDDLKTREGIARAKTEFTNHLLGGYVLCNGDEPLFEEVLKSRTFDGEIKTYGLKDNNDFIVEISDESDLKFRFLKPSTRFFKIHALGKHQALNAAAATAMAMLLGIKEDDIEKGLRNAKLTKFRTELIKGKKADYLNDAYKSNPSSLRAGLDTFYSLKGYDKKIAVIGDMLGIGEDAPKYHFDIGREIKSEKIDILFTYGNLAYEIHRGARENFKDRAKHFEDFNEMILAIKKEITDNTVILLKASNSEKFYEIPDRIEI